MEVIYMSLYYEISPKGDISRMLIARLMVQFDLAKDNAEWVFDKYEQYKHDTNPQRREQTATMSRLPELEMGTVVARVYDSA